MILTKSGKEKLLRVFLVVIVVLNAVPSSLVYAGPSDLEKTLEAGNFSQVLQGFFSGRLFQTSSCVTSGDLVVATGETCSLDAGWR